MARADLIVGEYAFYILGSYLAALVLMGGEVAMLVKRKNAVQRQASAISGKQQSDQQSTDSNYETSS